MSSREIAQMGLLIGIIFGICFVVLFVKLTRRDGSFKCKYDERQQIVRGRAFKYAFFGWMAFTIVCIAVDLGWEQHFMDQSLTLLCGMLVGIAIYASYSIWYDGYFSLNENPKRVMTLISVTTLCNILCAAVRIRHGLLENGVLTFLNGCNLLTAVASLSVLIVAAVKYGLDRKKLK